MTEASYAVSWAEGDILFVGRARLCARVLRLEGRGDDGREALRLVDYAAIRRLGVSRANGNRGLELELRDTAPVTIRSLDGLGSLSELADRVRTLTDSPQR